jgi:hypothetical protein
MFKERDQSKLRRCLIELYAAFDLHASKGFLSMINDNSKKYFSKKLYNDCELILNVLKPHRDETKEGRS